MNYARNMVILLNIINQSAREAGLEGRVKRVIFVFVLWVAYRLKAQRFISQSHHVSKGSHRNVVLHEATQRCGLFIKKCCSWGKRKT